MTFLEFRVFQVERAVKPDPTNGRCKHIGNLAILKFMGMVKVFARGLRCKGGKLRTNEM